MEIISHASNVTKGDGIVTEEKLKQAMASPADMIEVDLNLTYDGKFACVHDPKLNGKKIVSYDFADLKTETPELISIDDAIEITSLNKPLLMDVKTYWASTSKLLEYIKKGILSQYHNLSDKVYFESTDLDLLNELSDMGFNTIAIANLFTNPSKFCSHQVFDKLDAVALASELFYLKKYLKYLDENKKLYSWTWTQVYDETEKLFERYIDSGCDGIICDDVYKLEKVLKNKC